MRAPGQGSPFGLNELREEVEATNAEVTRMCSVYSDLERRAVGSAGLWLHGSPHPDRIKITCNVRDGRLYRRILERIDKSVQIQF